MAKKGSNEYFTKLENGLWQDNKTGKIGPLKPNGHGGFYVGDEEEPKKEETSTTKSDYELARPNTTKLDNMIEEGLVDELDVDEMALKYADVDSIKDAMRVLGYDMEKYTDIDSIYNDVDLDDYDMQKIGSEVLVGMSDDDVGDMMRLNGLDYEVEEPSKWENNEAPDEDREILDNLKQQRENTLNSEYVKNKEAEKHPLLQEFGLKEKETPFREEAERLLNKKDAQEAFNNSEIRELEDKGIENTEKIYKSASRVEIPNAEKLNETDKQTLIDYTDDMAGATSGHQINKWLSGKYGEERKQIAERQANKINALIKDPLPNNTRVYSQIPKEYVEGVEKSGDVANIPEFLSTSMFDNSDFDYGGNMVNTVIDVDEGTKAISLMDISRHPEEAEILFSNNQNLILKEIKDGKYYFVLKKQ